MAPEKAFFKADEKSESLGARGRKRPINNLTGTAEAR